MAAYNNEDFNPFHECDFVDLFFTLLLENGISEVDKNNIYRKLVYYYKDKKYKNLFSYTALRRNVFHDEVKLDDAIFFNSLRPSIIRLNTLERNIIYIVKPYEKLDKLRKLLSDEDNERINYMAYMIARLLKVEQLASYPVCIYPTTPDRDYVICNGNNGNDYRWDIITDGEVDRAYRFDDLMYASWYYDSPSTMNQVIKLKNGEAFSVWLKDGTYAILKGMKNEKNTRAEIYTDIDDEDMLIDIIEMAEEKDTMEKPFVKSLKK